MKKRYYYSLVHTSKKRKKKKKKTIDKYDVKLDAQKFGEELNNKCVSFIVFPFSFFVIIW